MHLDMLAILCVCLRTANSASNFNKDYCILIIYNSITDSENLCNFKQLTSMSSFPRAGVQAQCDLAQGRRGLCQGAD